MCSGVAEFYIGNNTSRWTGSQGLEALADQVFDFEARGRSGRLTLGEVALDIFAEDVGFKVDGVAGSTVSDVGLLVGVRDDGDFGDLIVPTGDGEADAVNGDGSLADDIGGEFGGDLDAEIPGIAIFGQVSYTAGGVDVAEDEVAAEFFACGERLFEIYPCAGFEGREGSLG